MSVDRDSACQPPADPRSEQRILRDRFAEAWDCYDWDDEACDDEGKSFRDAARAYRHFLERRVRQLERTIENFLETLPADVLRTELMSQLYGTRPTTTRDRNLLTTMERRLVNQYHRMDNASRHAVRTVCERLAATRSDEPESDEHTGDAL